MRHLAGAVTIVATEGLAGKGGLTATAVCSVSDSPPTLLACINQNNELISVLEGNKSFSVNILAQHHEALANRFAGFDKVTMEDRLAIGGWAPGTSIGNPILPDALASFECELMELKLMGSHFVVFGKIVGIEIGGSHTPLLYFNQSYQTTCDLVPTP